MNTKAEIQNYLGDDISWKSLYAVQNKIYDTREEAIVDCILWCGALDHKKLVELLNKELSK